MYKSKKEEGTFQPTKKVCSPAFYWLPTSFERGWKRKGKEKKTTHTKIECPPWNVPQRTRLPIVFSLAWDVKISISGRVVGFGVWRYFGFVVCVGSLPTQSDVPEPGLGPETNQAKEEGSLNDSFSPNQIFRSFS